MDFTPADLARLGIVPVAIRGVMPWGRSVNKIASAVREVPWRYLRLWLAAGGRLEVIAGTTAALHPRSICDDRRELGFADGEFCVVAADHRDAQRSAVHEIAHGLDFVLAYPSECRRWRGIWQRDVAAGKMFAWCNDATEHFAQAFCDLWLAPSYVSDEARNYLACDLVRASTA